MKPPKTTIFTRIVLASLLPFTLVFGVVLLAISNLIYAFNEERVQETTEFFAEHVTEKVTDTFQQISGLLQLTSLNMADAMDDSDDRYESVQNLLTALMDSNSEIYCAWYVFKHDSPSSEKEWYARSFQRREGLIREIPAVPDDKLMSPDVSPWHYFPYSTGVPYSDLVDYWDYGIGEGHEFTGTLAFPIIKDGVVIGSVGMDILYRQAFRYMNRWPLPGEREVMLLADNGTILYSRGEKFTEKDVQSLGFAQNDEKALQKVLSGGDRLLRTLQSPITGEKSQVYLSRVNIPDGNHRLYLYIDTPWSNLYSNADAIVKAVVFTCILGLAVMAIGAFLAARALVKPIRRITEFADRVANGNLTAAPDDLNAGGASREVIILHQSLKKMLEQLNQNHELKLYAMEAEYERKKTEEEARARTQFFANMSHEIRTPMNAIMGISDILLAEPLEERQSKYVKDIKASSESLLVIIDDILDIAKLESGKLALVNAHFSLTRVLENIASICIYLTRQKNLGFTLEREGDVPQCLYGDEVRLKQILLNLLGNAIKFTSEGSVTLKVIAGAETLGFDIIDTGAGIREEDRTHLFTAFKQVDTVKNRRVKGTGLGLSISMNLVKMMGGEITLYSVYGKGSTFHVRIPMILGDIRQLEEKIEDGDANAFDTDAKILVVDDNEVNLKVAAGVMKLFGLHCDTASSGQAALEKLQAAEYDLVFMDHMMPDMDGVETTRRIREMGGRFTVIPVIALTANAVSGVKEVLFDAGMDDYISKPIRKQMLQAVLAKWLPARPKQTTIVRTRGGEADDWLSMAGCIEDLDTQAGLSRAGGKDEAYRNRLRVVRDGMPNFIDAVIGRSLPGDDFFSQRGKLSALAVTLESIGATSLAAEAASLAQALTDGKMSYYKMHQHTFLADIQKLDANLRNLPL